MRKIVVIASLLFSMSGSWCRAASSIVSDADAVVVARHTPQALVGPRLILSLDVRRVMKGELVPGNLIQAERERRVVARRGAFRPAEGCGMWFLKREGSQWQILPMRGDLFFEMLFFPIGNCANRVSMSRSTSVDHAVFGEVAEAFRSGVVNNEDALSAAVDLHPANSEGTWFDATELSAAPETRLRELGVMLQLRQGDAAGLRGLIDLMSAENTDPNFVNMCSSPISVWTQDSEEAVNLLGAIATREFIPRERFIQYAASRALRGIHNDSSLPYLKRLLDHPEQRVRQVAVEGLSLHRLGVPSGLSEGAISRERSARHLKAFQAGEDLTGVHFGPFADKNAEEQIVLYWKVIP